MGFSGLRAVPTISELRRWDLNDTQFLFEFLNTKMDEQVMLGSWMTKETIVEIGKKCSRWIETEEETTIKNHMKWARIKVKGPPEIIPRSVELEKNGEGALMLSEKMNNNGEALPILSHESHVSKILRSGEDRHVGVERQMDCSNVQNLLVGHVGDSSSSLLVVIEAGSISSATYDTLDDEKMAIKFQMLMTLTEQEHSTTPMAIYQFPSFNSSDKKNTEAEDGEFQEEGEHGPNGLEVSSIDNQQWPIEEAVPLEMQIQIA
ncbi:hypothetical protein H5410_031825 [Solanum commersonii]|uniref:Uncharacterized protein n=1 Tax=Solanum commersonii TaxID=4109 RepID=A0A9J5YL35_SOLCO|nr:hypothetical protein H5410_031825 [Solanum commersonii]